MEKQSSPYRKSKKATRADKKTSSRTAVGPGTVEGMNANRAGSIGVLVGMLLGANGCAGTSQTPAKATIANPSTDVAHSASNQAPPPTSLGHCGVADGLPLLANSVWASSPEVSRDNLRATIGVLADPALHGRAAGSDDNRRVAKWLADQLAAYGLPPASGTDHCVPFARNDVKDQNVVAYLHRNADVNAPVVLVGAHYDAQGQRDADVFPGADDNASGVAALLEIARVSVGRKKGPDLVFAAFGAEERGLWGAKAYVNSPIIPFSRMRLMLNLDMVGRPMLDGSPLRFFISQADETLGFVLGPKEKAHTDEVLQRAAQKENRPIVGIPEVVLTRLGFGADSVPFGPHVPTIFLSTGDHADYHQPSDTHEKIDYDQITRAVQLSLRIIDEINSLEEPGN